MSQNFFWPPGSSNNIVIPAGLATAANQVLEIADLDSINSKTVHVDTGAVVVASSALPSGASTSSLQSTANTSLASIDTKLTSPLTVTGPLTDTQLRASAVPVSLAAVPLPAGAATEATLSSLNGKVTAVNTGAVVVSSSALPSGASTSALQSSMAAKSASAFINNPFDETVITYVGGTTDISTVVYKLASVVVNTLTMSYDGSSRLTGVVKT